MTFKQLLLLEAKQFNNSDDLIKAIKRGQLGVSPKKFFTGPFAGMSEQDLLDEQNTSVRGLKKVLKSFLDEIKNSIPQNMQNKAIMFALSKVGDFDSLSKITQRPRFPALIDTLSVYFRNKNKQVFSQNQQAKKILQTYEQNPFNQTAASKLEEYISQNIQSKKKAEKDKDYDIVFNQGDWKVYVPKSFSAASQLACMKSSKARWCTSADPAMFKKYTGQNNNLYIIRNEKTGTMFQMDWGGAGFPSFMDFNDRPVKYSNIKQYDIPKELWQSIKSKKGNSVYTFISKFEEKTKEKKKEAEKEARSLENINEEGWEIKEVEPSELSSQVKRGKIVGSEGNISMDKILSGDYSARKPAKVFIMKRTKTGKTYYGIKGSFDLNGEIVKNPVFEKQGSNLKRVSRQILLTKAKLPSSIASVFAGKNVEEFRKKELEPKEKIEGAEHYNLEDPEMVYKTDLSSSNKKKLVDRLRNEDNAHMFKTEDGDYYFLASSYRNDFFSLLNKKGERITNSPFKYSFVRKAIKNKPEILNDVISHKKARKIYKDIIKSENVEKIDGDKAYNTGIEVDGYTLYVKIGDKDQKIALKKGDEIRYVAIAGGGTVRDIETKEKIASLSPENRGKISLIKPITRILSPLFE